MIRCAFAALTLLCVSAVASDYIKTIDGKVALVDGSAIKVTRRDMSTAECFVLLGQSNADGRPADTSALSAYTLPLSGSQLMDNLWSSSSTEYNDGAWRSTDIRESTLWGPEISAAEYLATNGVAMGIKVAQGSTTLAVEWADGGSMWQRFERAYAAALAQSELSYGIQITNCAGVFWMQGESDATNTVWADAYYANMTNFIERTRAVVGAGTPFVIGRITTFYGTTANNTTVRDAQTNAANDIAGVSWVDTDSIYNSAHYDGAGLVQLGKWFAQELTE